MPTASAAAAETALIVYFETLSVSASVSSSTYVWPSGASSDQLRPGTRIDSLSLSTSCHFVVSV